MTTNEEYSMIASSVREYRLEINERGNSNAIITFNCSESTFHCRRSFRTMEDKEVTVYNFESYKEMDHPTFFEMCKKVIENNT